MPSELFQQIRDATHAGARSHAMEINPLYVEVALRRWDRFSGQGAVRLDG